ncbi:MULTISPECIES: tetratricopeptide repeat protein [Thalassobaculum]|uniref:Predicted methyltransferase, contains TPR repeat n=1 Tax=Thalassobaculum litoreum DSM 18839 TaxID=1123362 RepID=A0A8G2F5C3_9PROT|nr:MULTISPECIES: tetratricopeptide repeat protein [Thalassobaculum]SDG45812.1 Predicted methyltransferase, contains TPR repeat [Thalassobaculum litoreum DSM 18839]
MASATLETPAPVLVAQAIRAHQLGHLDAAQDLYGRALAADPLDSDALNLMGTLMLQRGDLSSAVPFSAKAVLVDPRAPGALNTLGLILRQAGQIAAAASCYQKALLIDDGFADAYSNLGVILKSEGHLLRAIEYYRRALDLDPTLGETYNNLANAYQEIGELPEAVEAYLHAADRMPDSDTVHYNVGMLLNRQGQTDDALIHLKRALEINPERSDARHLVAALEGRTTQRAPLDYVRKLFDDYAPRFEAHLVGDLQCRIHLDIVGLLNQHRRGRRFGRALDLGCGTGLTGAAARGFVDHLAGVDLSENMLRQAEVKGVYDALRTADIDSYLEEADQRVDLVMAGDVFIYMGALDKTIGLIADRLNDHGMLAFSVEAEVPAASWVLRPSGRFGHGDAYISSLMAENGLAVVDKLRTALRNDRGKPITGIIYLAEKIAA